MTIGSKSSALVSEDAVLARINNFFPASHPSLLLGRGDDCAAIKCDGLLCLSTDLFIEDTHFRRSYFTPQEIGHKALAVNLSDLAACGARPMGFSLGLGLPPDVDFAFIDAMFESMSRLAQSHRLALTGGDMSRSPNLSISITIFGEVSGPGKYLTRGGAMPGDSIFIIGQLGLASVGLAMLEQEGNAAREAWPASCAAHLKPMPLVDEGLIIAKAMQYGRPVVLMDVSDGLARDLPRLLGLPGGGWLGAELVMPEALLHPEVIRYARQHHHSALEYAFGGGEDYALLGACSPDLLPALHAALPHMTTIGNITDTGQIRLNGGLMETGAGFDHFACKF